MLVERLADALDHAAMDLAGDQHRVHHHTEIIDRDIAVDRGDAGLRVNLDLGQVAAIGEGPLVDLGGRLGIHACDALGRSRHGARLGGQLQDADLAIGADHLEAALGT